MSLRLFHNHTLIGTITNICMVERETHDGDIALTPESYQYKPVFDYLTDPDQLSSGNLALDDSYFDNWYLIDEAGQRKEIEIPGIYFDEGRALWQD